MWRRVIEPVIQPSKTRDTHDVNVGCQWIYIIVNGWSPASITIHLPWWRRSEHGIPCQLHPLRNSGRMFGSAVNPGLSWCFEGMDSSEEHLTYSPLWIQAAEAKTASQCNVHYICYSISGVINPNAMKRREHPHRTTQPIRVSAWNAHRRKPLVVKCVGM